MRLRLLLLLLGLAVPVSGRTETPTKDEYRLGPEDVVQVQVWGRADLTGQAEVDQSGSVRLPLLGTVEAANRTTAELGSELTKRYSIIDSRISEVLVSVLQYNSRRVNVVGEVRNPGRYGFHTMPGLWDAIVAAGGPTPTANLAQVQVVRKQPAESEPKTITVDLSGGIAKVNPDSLPQLRPQDTIIIPSAAGEVAAVPTGDTFQVFGSVRTPGAYRLTAPETVIDALAASGGPLPNADLSKVHVTRPTPSGLLAFELNLEEHLQHGKAAPDLHLQSGDTVMIPDKGGWAGKFFGGLSRYIIPLLSVATSVLVIKNYSH